ncbi:TPA: hypothetical protein ACKP2Y_000137 [Pseudomonas putida]
MEELRTTVGVFERLSRTDLQIDCVGLGQRPEHSAENCFNQVCPYGTEGRHYTMRPQGFDYDHSEPMPEALEAMRKSYRAMEPLQRIMVLTLLHLYLQESDKIFLTGGCPTKISAAEALKVLRQDG